MVDIWPRRDLPGRADEWGRTAETRIDSNQATIEALQTAVQSQNRNSASSLAVLGDAIKSIPITTSTSDFVTDFALPIATPDWNKTAEVFVSNPSGRNQLSLFCVGNVRIFETVDPSSGYIRSIIRVYSQDTGSLMYWGGSSPAVKSAWGPGTTVHAASPLFARRFTSPPGGVRVTIELQSIPPANFPAHPDNLAELAVQTSFL